MFVNIHRIDFFVVLKQAREILSAHSKFTLGFVVDWVLFYYLFADVRVHDVKVPAYFFE